MLNERLRSMHDRVLVLTLPGAADRQRHITEQLGEANFEFVYGIDKSTVSVEQMIAEGKYDDRLARKLSRHHTGLNIGQICCALGHLLIYRQIVERGYRRTLIFEDDATALDVGGPTVDAMIADVPDDAGLVYWGWSGGRYSPRFGNLQQAVFHVRRLLGMHEFTHRMIGNYYMRPFNEHFDVAASNYLAHAYSITLPAAGTLIKWNTPVTLPADYVLNRAILAGEVRGYVCRPLLFGQKSLDPESGFVSQTQD